MSKPFGIRLIISLFALMGIFNHAVLDSSLTIIAAQEVIIVPCTITYFTSEYHARECHIQTYPMLQSITKVFAWILVVLAIAPLSGIVEFKYGELFLKLYNDTLNPPIEGWMYLEMVAIFLICWHSSNVGKLVIRRAVRS